MYVVELPNNAKLSYRHHILKNNQIKADPKLGILDFGIISGNMAMSLTQACKSLALSTWLLSFCFMHLLCLDFTVAEKEEWYTAFVNITYLDPVTSELKTDKSECGRYGEHSPKRDARGFVFMPVLPQDRQGCDGNAKFPLPHPSIPWIALIARGNCTYREKIRNAAVLNASAVVIFNVGSSSSNDTITMPHYGTGDVVAIMIPEHKGREIVALLEKNITVAMHISIGTRNLQKYVSRTSVVFVSISFIVLMIISLAWLVFYYIQRFRYANARDRNQEADSEFDNCAVCIEDYKPNDVVRILPCRHVFHKSCVDPWLQDHRTCPMCKMNILKALGIPASSDCSEDSPPDYELPSNPVTGASEVSVGQSSPGEHRQSSPSNESNPSLIFPAELVLSDIELQSEPEQDDEKS
ncbi:hypothetical protein DNTS_034499 [Danionella cerebrum]|uniref:RING-type domain-containing protein n=1 Tax=Danionella cerebrum TaxID=2873325 RepID=A0A553MLL6_9TELE|nr:hypothetical protein DNTS_034499 [Danionella translucida]